MATLKVWLPGPDWVAARGGLPRGMTADVWTGGEELPDSAGEVEFVMLPFGMRPSGPAVATSACARLGSSGPTPSRTSRVAPGISPANAFALPTGKNGSVAPCTTSVGAVRPGDSS